MYLRQVVILPIKNEPSWNKNSFNIIFVMPGNTEELLWKNTIIWYLKKNIKRQ